MDQVRVCPKCGTVMTAHPVTSAEGETLYAGGAPMTSLVCSSCGHAELQAGEAPEGASPTTIIDARDGLSAAEQERIAEAMAKMRAGVDPEMLGALGLGSGGTGGDAAPSTPDAPAAGSRPGLRHLASRVSRAGFSGPFATAARPVGAGTLIVIGLSAGVALGANVLLYFAAGPIMRQGGFAAIGGPYVISSPGPAWMPAVLLAFLAGIAGFFTNLVVASGADRPT